MTIDILQLLIGAVGMVLAILVPVMRMVSGIKNDIHQIQVQAAEANGGQMAKITVLEAEQKSLQNRMRRAEEKIFPVL